MKIISSTHSDLDTILRFYEHAVAHQKKVFNRHWQPFDVEMIRKEIDEQRQWKMIVDNEVVCIFAITYNDPQIWKEKDIDPSIYLHRIVTRPDQRGKYFVKDIIRWANDFGEKKHKKFIRLDTWGDNQKLIDYYVHCGFNFLDLVQLGTENDLPPHYQNANLSLFEIAIKTGD